MVRTNLDLWLDRGMKIIGLLGFFGAVFMAFNGVMTIPKTLAKNASEIEVLKQYREKNELAVQSLTKDVSYLTTQTEKIDKKIDRILEMNKV